MARSRGRRRRVAPRRRRVKIALVATLGVALIGVSVFGLMTRYGATHGEAAPLDHDVVTFSGDPDEIPPDPRCLDGLAADQPKRITLPGIDIVGCMQKVGVDDENRIATPTNLHVAGWFVDSDLPGSDGLSIVVGHQTGKYVGGIFDHLGDLAEGDEFSIELGDGTVKTFRITSLETHPVADTMSSLYADASTQGANLALITCSGPYDREIDQRRDRLVVLAVTV